jgi:zeaxanthin glucosyltransferase
VSKFLFVVLPLAGHVNPALAVGQALTDAGHDVAWCGPETFLRPLVGPDATVHPTGMRLYREPAGTGHEAVVTLWSRYLVPLARFILPAVDEAVRAYRPDLLLVDQHAMAGALVAHRHRIPWASLAPTVTELTQPFRTVPELDTWMHEQMGRLRTVAGIPDGEAFDLRFSPHLVVSFVTAALTDTAALPDNCVLVGPALGRRDSDPSFPFDWLDPTREHVLVTTGTLADSISTDFFQRVVTALDPLADRLQATLIASPDVAPNPPAHILVAPRVPVLDVMPHVDAVVSHGGLNTVSESLAQGVPLVVAPIRYDQSFVADKVAEAGAGVQVSFRAATPPQLRDALIAVLDEPAYRAAAGRVRDEMAAAGGAARAAECLAQLAHSRRSATFRHFRY